MMIDFLLMKLDPSCSAVLGYRWLAHYNPWIDWFHGHITFNTQISPTVAHDFALSFVHEELDDSLNMDNWQATAPQLRQPQTLSPPRKTAGFRAPVDHVDIRFISAVAFDLD